MIVVDTNVIACLYLPREFTSRAEALLVRDADWRAPPLWRSEFRNILAGYLRRGNLTAAQALAIQLEAESLMASGEEIPDSHCVLALVCGSDCSAYDCEFVAVAQMLGAPLITMDAKLLRAFPKTARSLGASD